MEEGFYTGYNKHKILALWELQPWITLEKLESYILETNEINNSSINVLENFYNFERRFSKNKCMAPFSNRTRFPDNEIYVRISPRIDLFNFKLNYNQYQASDFDLNEFFTIFDRKTFEMAFNLNWIIFAMAIP